MRLIWKPVLASFVVACIVSLFGVMLFFDPIARADKPEGPIVPPAIGFFIYVALSIALFDWAARQMQSAFKAAFLIAASQFILVNVDFVLAGKRGLMTGAASTLLIAITWASIAFAYRIFARKESQIGQD